MIPIVQIPLMHGQAISAQADHPQTMVSTGDSFIAKLAALMISEQPQDGAVEQSEMPLPLVVAESLAQMIEMSPEEMTEEQLLIALLALTVNQQGQQHALDGEKLQRWLHEAQAVITSLEQQRPLQHGAVELNSAVDRLGSVMQAAPATAQQMAQALHTVEVQERLVKLWQQLDKPQQSERMTGEHHAMRQLFDQFREQLYRTMKSDVLAVEGRGVQRQAAQMASVNLSQSASETMILTMLGRMIERHGAHVQPNANNQPLPPLVYVPVMHAMPVSQMPNVSLSDEQLDSSFMNVQRMITVSDEGELESQPLPSAPTPIVVRSPEGQQHLAERVPLVQAQQFAEQAESIIIRHLRIAQVNGASEARISLVPEHLGHVDVHIALKNGQMVAQFVVDNLSGKELLEGQLGQLRTTLQAQGIQVDKLEVLQGQQSQMFQQQHEQQTARQSAHISKHKKPSYDFVDEHYAAELGTADLHRAAVYGSSFEAVV